MDPILAAGLLQGAGAASGGFINALSTGRQNKLSRRWSEKMYKRQTADSIKFWNMQNAYNHPKAQFQRMLDSGLNPKLMYEKGSPGTAGPINTPDMQPVENRVPDFGSGVAAAGGVLANMYDLRIGHAQANLLEAQSKKVMVESAISEIQYAFDTLTFEDRKQNVFFQQQLSSAQLNNALQDWQIKSDTHIRNMEQLTANLLKTIAETANIRATKAQIDASINEILKSTELKQIQIDTGEQSWIKAIPAIKKLVIQLLSDPNF